MNMSEFCVGQKRGREQLKVLPIKRLGTICWSPSLLGKILYTYRVYCFLYRVFFRSLLCPLNARILVHTVLYIVHSWKRRIYCTIKSFLHQETECRNSIIQYDNYDTLTSTASSIIVISRTDIECSCISAGLSQSRVRKEPVPACCPALRQLHRLSLASLFCHHHGTTVCIFMLSLVDTTTRMRIQLYTNFGKLVMRGKAGSLGRNKIRMYVELTISLLFVHTRIILFTQQHSTAAVTVVILTCRIIMMVV